LKSKNSAEQNRITILDEIRGLSIIMVVLYHFLFSAGEVFDNDTAARLLRQLMPIEPLIASPFVFISGICTRLSRSNLKRGITLLVIALGINIITQFFFPEFAIRFGVMNLLSVSMIIYDTGEKLLKKRKSKKKKSRRKKLFSKKKLQKLKPYVAFTVFIIIFALTWGLNYRYIGIFGLKLFSLPEKLFKSKYLFPLGFRNRTFYSSDYFPIFPWLFLFLGGSSFAKCFSNRKLPKSFYTVHSQSLSSVGKNTLIIYLLHQPIIFGLLYLINRIKF